jgi:hypothetical protein
MSALGQKQTFAPQKAMSALPPIATAKANFRTRSCLLYPRKRTCAVHSLMSALGHKRTHAAQQKGLLFDHFVGDLLKMDRYVEAQRLGGLEIDDQLELARPQDWHVDWLLSQGRDRYGRRLGGQARCCWVHSSSARLLRHPRERIDRGQCAARRQCGELNTQADEQRSGPARSVSGGLSVQHGELVKPSAAAVPD